MPRQLPAVAERCRALHWPVLLFVCASEPCSSGQSAANAARNAISTLYRRAVSRINSAHVWYRSIERTGQSPATDGAKAACIPGRTASERVAQWAGMAIRSGGGAGRGKPPPPGPGRGRQQAAHPPDRGRKEGAASASLLGRGAHGRRGCLASCCADLFDFLACLLCNAALSKVPTR